MFDSLPCIVSKIGSKYGKLILNCHVLDSILLTVLNSAIIRKSFEIFFFGKQDF